MKHSLITRALRDAQLTATCLTFIAAHAGATAAQSDTSVDWAAAELEAGSLDGVAVSDSSHGTIAVGPRYRAHFSEHGLTFTTALGRDAERAPILAMQLERIAIGASDLPLDSEIDQRLLDQRISYRRSPTVVERYDATSHGLELSFVFDELPPVDGDLVVALDLQTELVLERSSTSDGLWLTNVGSGVGRRGGVHIGGVTGIDAEGVTVDGWIELVNGRVELGLPAEFVSRAALPLVLDPLIGPIVDITDGVQDEVAADIAWDEQSKAFGVCWERWYSSEDVDVHAVSLSPSGAVINTYVLEPSAALRASKPAIGFNRGLGRFVVAWQESTSILGPHDIRARSFNWFSTTLSSTISVASGSGNEVEPDVSSESENTVNTLLVTWTEFGAGAYAARVSAASPPVVEFSGPALLDLNVSRSAISKGGGVLGLHLLVCEARDGAGKSRVRGVFVDRSGLTGEEVGVANSSTESFTNPDVDGDGERFTVVYERELLAAPGDRDVLAQPIFFNNGFLEPLKTPIDVATGLFTSDTRPSVASQGQKIFVAWAADAFDLFGGIDPVPDVYVTAYNKVNYQSCEPVTRLQQNGIWDARPKLTSQESGGAPGAIGGGVGLVWQQQELSAPFDGEIRFQAIDELSDGAAAILGGGCGSGGTISIGDKISPGNAFLETRLDDVAPEAVIAVLNLTGTGLQTTCGSCTYDNWLLTFVPPIETSPFGERFAVAKTPVPCNASLIGNSYVMQWTSFFTNASPCPVFANFSFSDRMQITIGN